MDLYSALSLIPSHVAIVRSAQTSFMIHTILVVEDYVPSCNVVDNNSAQKTVGSFCITQNRRRRRKRSYFCHDIRDELCFAFAFDQYYSIILRLTKILK